MKPVKRLKINLAIDALLFFILARLALSYLQPGPASFLIKIIISGLAGFVLTYKHIWKTFRSLFSKIAPGQRKKEAEDK